MTDCGEQSSGKGGVVSPCYTRGVNKDKICVYFLGKTKSDRVKHRDRARAQLPKEPPSESRLTFHPDGAVRK
jgi:hypothetical protein